MSKLNEAANEQAVTQKSYPYDITLPSGNILTVTQQPKVKHMTLAQKRMQDPSQLPQALIAVICKLNGNTIVMEDVEEWPIADYTPAAEALELMGNL